MDIIAGQAEDDAVDWRQRGRCSRLPIDELEGSFWAFDSDEAGLAAAKSVCVECQVATQCLSWALETGQDFGVWGGMTAEERRKLRQPVVLRALGVAA